MPGTDFDARFEAAMRELTEMHAEATLYRSSSETAERAFGDAMRVGDGVRRAVRQGRVDRPNEDDCAELGRIATRLRGALVAVTELPQVRDLASSLERAQSARAAELAVAIFADLEYARPAPSHGYRAVPLRGRRRGGESILLPEDLARRLLTQMSAGLMAETTERTGSSPSETRIPTAIELSPSLDGCGSELSFRVDLAAIGLPILRHGSTGDLWVFASEPIRALEIAAAANAEDEWWAASPIRYGVYLDRLARSLAKEGVEMALEGERASS